MTSGVGGGDAGVQAHPQKFWFGENQGKISENLWKPSQNPWKSAQTPWKYGQKWRPTCFDLKKMTPIVCGIQWRPFFGGHPKNGRHEKIFAQKVKSFGSSLEKFGQNPSHPQKFACSYTYGFDQCLA